MILTYCATVYGVTQSTSGITSNDIGSHEVARLDDRARRAVPRMATRPDGLTSQEAAERLAERGPNVLAKDQRAGIGKLLKHAAINPLVILLAVLATISFANGDARSRLTKQALPSGGPFPLAVE